MPLTFEEIEHTADRAFTARGRDMQELFVHAAQAIFELQPCTAPGPRRIKRDVEVTGLDRETLLVNWLNELLYLSERFQERYDSFEILDLFDQCLRARLWGTQQVAATNTTAKAVTFHNLAIRREGVEWAATLVVDV